MPLIFHMCEYLKRILVRNNQSKLHLEKLSFYPCSAKWVEFQKFDTGDNLAFSNVSAVSNSYAVIFQK